MATNCEDYNRSLHDPLDTKCFRETINKQTVLWHRVHQLPTNYEIPLGSKVGKVAITFSRVTSNTMEMSVSLCLACGWSGTVHLNNDYIPSALRPVEASFDTSRSCTVFRLENLQRLREDLKVWLQFQLSFGVYCCQFTVSLPLGRPLIAFAYTDRVPTTTLPTSSLTNTLTMERKEAMEHTEDHSLSSNT